MSNSAVKQLILCADDFGIAPGVNKAILELIQAGRINATSCMTSMPDWSEDAARLKPLAGRIQVGLHVTLTDQASLAPMPKLAPDCQLPNMGKLLNLAITRRLNQKEIFAEILRQYDAFCKIMGNPPDFIDGHHHVHQFPVIRNAVIELIKQKRNINSPWVRVCWESPARLISRGESIGRALSIGIFGLRLKRLARNHGISHNMGFTGIYDYQQNTMNEELVSRLLKNAIDNTVMFCHPGFVDERLIKVDGLTDPRELEYKFLRGDDFQKILKRMGFSLL